MWRVRKSPSCTDPFFISFSYSVSSFFFGFSVFTESTATVSAVSESRTMVSVVATNVLRACIVMESMQARMSVSRFMLVLFDSVGQGGADGGAVF